MKTMKILIATPIYPPVIGGPATYTKELETRLGKDHHVVVVAYSNTPSSEHARTVSPNLPLPIRLWKFGKVLWRESKNVDVIYVQNAMAAGLPAAVVGILRKKPVVLKFVGDEAWERASQHKKTEKRLEVFLARPDAGLRYRMMMCIERFVLQNVTLITTPSEYLGHVISSIYTVPKERIRTNFNATDTAHITARTRIPFQIAVVARLVPWKGISEILEAVALIQQKFPKVTLKIAGDGPERELLEQKASSLGITERITFLGSIPKSEVTELLATSSVFVLNSTYEGLPHVVLESFNAKTPVVASDTDGTNELVIHEKTGLLTPLHDVEVLAKSIERLYSDEKLRVDVTIAAHTLLIERHSWESHIRTLETFFKEVTQH